MASHEATKALGSSEGPSAVLSMGHLYTKLDEGGRIVKVWVMMNISRVNNEASSNEIMMGASLGYSVGPTMGLSVTKLPGPSLLELKGLRCATKTEWQKCAIH